MRNYLLKSNFSRHSVTQRQSKQFRRKTKKRPLAGKEEPSLLLTVRFKALELLGSFGNQFQQCLTTKSHQYFLNYISWETQKNLQFQLPFSSSGITIELGNKFPPLVSWSLSVPYPTLPLPPPLPLTYFG